MQLGEITDIRQELDEGLRVVLWRAAVLEQAGYDEEIAFDLAVNRDVDLHLAARLLQQGCPQTTALRILL
jgi:hypothetical protein